VRGVSGEAPASGTCLAATTDLLLLGVGSESFRAACGGAAMMRGGG
jgi:hypothetical protein